MIRKRAIRHRPRRSSPADFGMVVFVTLVGLIVMSRINFLSAVVLAPDCLSIQPVLLGQDGRIDAVLDTAALAGLAALGLIAATGVIAVHEKTGTWIGAAIGAVNTGIAGLLIAQWVIGWAFFHPDSWQAKLVMPMGPEIRYLFPRSASARGNEYEGLPGWQTVGPNTYYNAGIGIFARKERIKACFQAAFVRQNMLNMNTDGLTPDGVLIASIPDEALERHTYAFIFYDRYNQYLTSDVYWAHDQYPELQRRDSNRDASGRRVEPSEVWRLVQGSLNPVSAEPGSLRPYSLQEINDMVRKTWDRDAPEP